MADTMSLDDEFTKVADEVKKLKKTPSDDELLILYGLFKQATVGDNETARPGMFDLKGRAKWDAWNGRKGMSKEEAKAEYVKYAQGLIKQYA